MNKKNINQNNYGTNDETCSTNINIISMIPVKSLEVEINVQDIIPNIE